MPFGRPQTESPTRLAAARVQAGITQIEIAEAIGIPIATYKRLEQGKHKNPRLRWFVNAAIALGYDDHDELLEDWMREWHPFNGTKRPEPEWRERPEVLARAARWREREEHGD